jgi:hypothetical protein
MKTHIPYICLKAANQGGTVTSSVILGRQNPYSEFSENHESAWWHQDSRQEAHTPFLYHISFTITFPLQ